MPRRLLLIELCCIFLAASSGTASGHLRWVGDPGKYRGGAVYYSRSSSRSGRFNLTCQSSVADNSLSLEKLSGGKWVLFDDSVERSASGISLKSNKLDSSTYRCKSKTSSELDMPTLDVYVSDSSVTQTTVADLMSSSSLRCNFNGKLGKHGVALRLNNFILPSDRFELLENQTVRLHQVNLNSSGVYVCSVGTESGNFTTITEVEGPAIAHDKVGKGRNKMEGEKVTINCDIFGHPTPVVTWLRNGEPLTNETKRVFLGEFNGVANASLQIENLEEGDRAEYACVGANKFGSANATAPVRVKDRLAALWPFLGIVVEVVILVTIIFFYERRKAKQELEEATADAEQRKALTSATAAANDRDIRQRKA